MNQTVSKIHKTVAFAIIHFLFFYGHIASSQTTIPRPDHTVIVMFENKSYSQMINSSGAPYIHSLLADTNTAVFTQSFSLTHPSQPNYLMLFSGNDQGVTTDNIFSSTPFTTCNLAASLIQNGFTFTGYCEDMPSVGYLGNKLGLYYRKHNPWSNWQGTSTNDVSATVNQPFTAFPANYSLLPDVSFVIPNMDNCMHNGSISLGDSWLQNNLGNYIQWARTNNSLLIVTFDEDDHSEGNRILTFFYGPMIRGGTYSTTINHFNVLRTLEDIYHLSYCGNSGTATTIDYVWKPFVGIKEQPMAIADAKLFPNPATNKVALKVNITKNSPHTSITLIDVCGKIMSVMKTELKCGENLIELNCALPAGIYSVKITSTEVQACCRLVIE